MAEMFEKDEAGFTEDYDPNAEPGATAEAGAAAEPDAEEAPAPAETAEADASEDEAGA
jgi:large subunit ribosomal protein L9